MKKTITIMFSVSAFAGFGYLLWAYSPMGKSVLGKWLLRRWAEIANREKIAFDTEAMSVTLRQLSYFDTERLFWMTRMDMFTKDQAGTATEKDIARYTKLLKAIHQRSLALQVDLSPLQGIILPS